jgi:Zn-dependent peptidase ImmA (M78 family)/transcriptional regulator with XRE-family HTH domain
MIREAAPWTGAAEPNRLRVRMSKSVPALVNPALLQWARESIGFEVAEVAEHLDVPEQTIAAWESGDRRPTMREARALADVYKRPLAVFYLPEPPRAFDAMRFFRTRPGEAKPAPSPVMAIRIRDAESRREIALELAEALGEKVDPVTLRAQPGDQPGPWARTARLWLGVSLEEQASWTDEYHAFRSWRAALERMGVLVFQVSKVPADVRGFSIDADRYPVIAVSSKDAVRARIFTLFHELGHLVLGRGELDEGGHWGRASAAEVFCNEFAAQMLVPGDALEAQLGEHRGLPAAEIGRDDIRRLLSTFWVSEEVLLLRLVATGRLERGAYERRRAELSLLQPAKPSGPVPVPRKTVQSLGNRFVRSVLAAADSNHITLSDVAGYLGVRLKHLPEIERLVARGASGVGA